MRQIFIIVFFWNFIFSQEREKLYYYIDKNSLFGVKNDKGKVIIPAQFRNLLGTMKQGEQINDNIIHFYDLPKGIQREKNRVVGCYFNRKGDYLHQPFLFDNGPDYLVEGLYRFVRNGKVGFANRNGEEVVAAQYDFASPFRLGYSEICMECKWIPDGTGEHWVVSGGTRWIINTKGERVEPLPNKISERDVEINGKYYPNPFHYSDNEQKILQFFEKKSILIDLYYLKFSDKVKKEEKKFRFEIIERPMAHFPYYYIIMYDDSGTLVESFLASTNGKERYHTDFWDRKKPFNLWLKQEIEAAIEYQKTHKDKPNKIPSEVIKMYLK